MVPSYFIDLADTQGKTIERVAATTLPTELRKAGLRVSFSYRVLDNSSAAASNYSGGCSSDNSHSQGNSALDNVNSTDQKSISICDCEILP